jgi:hypothetical protein
MVKNHLHQMNLVDRRDALRKINRAYSADFTRNRHERLAALKSMGVKPFAFKCSDGRPHAASYTGLTEGVIHPFRNIGGRFNMKKWYHLNTGFLNEMKRWEAIVEFNLVLASAHKSEGSIERCCSGFKNDTPAAMLAAATLRDQLLELFPAKKGGRFNVYPVHCCFETDEERLLLYNEHGDEFDPKNWLDASRADVTSEIDKMFRKAPQKIRDTLVVMEIGNILHTKEIVRMNRPIIDMEHRECILGIGKGFWYIMRANKIIIIGPYDPDLHEQIGIGAKIIKENIDSGRIKNGFILMASTLADPDDVYPARARALGLLELAETVIKKTYPEMLDIMLPMPVIVNRETMAFEEVHYK